MSSDSPVSIWKCGNCGTQNRFANPTCVQCNNPRPADVAMPGGPSRAATPTNFGPLSDPTSPGQRPAPPAYGAGRPAPYGGESQPMRGKAKMGMPAGLLVLVVYEAISIIYNVYNQLVVAPASMKLMQQQMHHMAQPPGVDMGMKAGLAIGMGFVIFSIVLRLLFIMGFFTRWSWIRILGIIRYALSMAGGVLGMGGMVMGVILIRNLSKMQGQMGASGRAMPPMPPIPAFGSSHLAMALAVVVVSLIMGIYGVWYLTSNTAKEYFSE